MLQFYFLSIVLNAVAGYILITADNEGVLEFKSGFSLKNETTKLVVGILSMITGLMKILSVIEDDIPVIGDLIPAVCGLAAGFILILEYYRGRSSLEASENTRRIDRIFVSNKKFIGFAALIAALLHFLFPKVLLL